MMTSPEHNGQKPNIAQEVRETLVLTSDGYLQAGAIKYKLAASDRQIIGALGSRPGKFMTPSQIVVASGWQTANPSKALRVRWPEISRFADGRFEHAQDENSRRHSYRMLGDIVLINEMGVRPIPTGE